MNKDQLKEAYEKCCEHLGYIAALEDCLKIIGSGGSITNETIRHMLESAQTKYKAKD